MFTKKAVSYIVGSLIAVGLIGCSKTEEAKVEEKPTSVKVIQADTFIPNPDVKDLPKGNPSTPLSQYQEIKSNKQLAYIYLSFNDSERANTQVAESFDIATYNEKEPFKKKDLVEKVKNSISSDVAKAKEDHYYYIDIEADGGRVIHDYDVSTKSFKIVGIEFDTKSYNLPYNIGGKPGAPFGIKFSNGVKFSQLKVEDEALARKISSLIQDPENYKVNVYFFTQGDSRGQTVSWGEIMKVQVTDKEGNVLAEIK